MQLKVIKRDGQLEDFDPQKIARVVQAAGLEPDQADQLAKQVITEIDDHKNPISSLIIRDLVIGRLHHINENAANLFTWYEKTKDNPPTAA